MRQTHIARTLRRACLFVTGNGFKVAALAVAALLTSTVSATASPFDMIYYFNNADPADAADANNAIRIRIADVTNFALDVGAAILTQDNYAAQADQNYPGTFCDDITPAGCIQYTMTPRRANPDNEAFGFTNPYSIEVAWLDQACVECIAVDPAITGDTDNFSQVTVAFIDGPTLLKAPGSDFAPYAGVGDPNAVSNQVFFPTGTGDIPLGAPEPGSLILLGSGAVAAYIRRRRQQP